MKDEKSIWQVFPFKLNEQLSIAQLLIVFGGIIISLLVIVKCNSSENTTAQVENQQKTPMEATPSITTSNKESSNKRSKPPLYKSLRKNTVYCDYEVLISEVDKKSITYKKDVESILDDLAHKYGRTTFTVWIYDNAKAAELNYKDLEIGKKLSRQETTLVNRHVVAIYSNTSGHYNISYFEFIPAEDRGQYKAWSEAFNESEFNRGYVPKI